MVFPHNYQPRDYQLPLLTALDGQGYKRAIQVWHRRSGKDITDFNYMVKRAAQEPGTYYYFFPTYSQGKKILWDGMTMVEENGQMIGKRIIYHHLPKSHIRKMNDSTMQIELWNGSIIQVIGTDNIDTIVGTNPRGCIFSEYSLQDPTAWQYIRPILAVNGGWAIFNFTPRGENHAYDLLKMAEKDPERWFITRLTADQTKVLPPDVLEQEKREMHEQTGDDALFYQEYFVSFNAPVQGSYYAEQVMLAQQEGRITKVPYDRATSVHTAWDLGMDDSMTIWFYQYAGMEVHFIDYYESNGKGLEDYAKVLQEKGYAYGNYYFPHDIEVRELGTGKSRLEVSKQLGMTPAIVIPNLHINDGINAARQLFNRCWFDEEKCARGLSSLKNYHKAYDEKRKKYDDHPEHDWASHGADAFRYFALGYKNPQKRSAGFYVQQQEVRDDTLGF